MTDENINETRRGLLGVSALAASGVVISSSLTASALPDSAQGAEKAAANEISVLRIGSQPSTRGAPGNFTGSVHVASRFQREDPARIGGGVVSFEPAARTAWHTHPLGQTLVVTAGVGLVQAWDGPVQEIRPGDIVWIPPHVKHWHGATSAVGMTHAAISTALDGKSAEWMELVSDAQYSAGPLVD